MVCRRQVVITEFFTMNRLSSLKNTGAIKLYMFVISIVSSTHNIIKWFRMKFKLTHYNIEENEK